MTTTVGIDLAADPRGTAIASIAWAGESAVVDSVLLGAADDVALHWMHHPDGAVGIDCPFGWPAKFVDLVAQHSSHTLQLPSELPQGWRREYVLRATDRWVHDEIGLVPLSVAADRIGHTAIRLVALLAQLSPHIHAPLDGSGALAEIYPAAALKVWGLPFRGYKGSTNAARLHQVVDELTIAAPWLRLGIHEEIVRGSDHVLDAVVSALVARAVSQGKTAPPDDPDLARVEGWIHIPRRPLSELP